jgi:hypothetical protein
MPLQYAEKINAARSGMARAAQVSGRDSRAQDDTGSFNIEPAASWDVTHKEADETIL